MARTVFVADDGHGRSLRTAFLVALALHAAVVIGLVYGRSIVEAPPGEQEVQLDLAPQSVDAPTVETADSELTAGDPPPAETARAPEAQTVQPPKESKAEEAPPDATAEKPAETKPVETKEEARAVTAEKAEPPPPAETAKPTEAAPADVKPIESTAETAPEMPTEAVTAQEEPKPTDKPTPPKTPDPVKKTEQQRPQAARARDRQQAAERRRLGQAGESGYNEQRVTRNASSRENNFGRGARADPNALGRYAAQLAAALRGRLRYPSGAHGRGVAVLRFVVHRSGRVISASIARSAGDPALDRAALATASPGSTLPPAPAGVPQQTLSVSVPLQFN